MTVSTIYQPNKSKSPSSAYLVYFLIVLALFVIAYFGYGFVKNAVQIRGTSALIVDTEYGTSEVFLNDDFIGTTPFESSDIKPGENKLSLRNENIDYEISLRFLANSEVVVTRDLGISQTFSSGQNFWLEKKDSDVIFSIVSIPSGADVFIDGSLVGQTPYSSTDLSAGGYDLRVELLGYESQEARIEVNDGHKLNSSMALFPKPVPDKVSLLEGSESLYDIVSSDLSVVSNPSEWSKAVVYWNDTRGINLAGAGVNKERVFGYMIDYDGNLYNENGNEITVEEFAQIQDSSRGAYLRREADGAGLSEKARETFLSLENVGTVLDRKTATILDTGLGWLRVRDQAGLDGTEITRVDVGETFNVLDETAGWVKIQVSESVEGWVSDTYVSINE